MPPTRATTPDGVTLALHDLGGVGPPALLVHATGFHGRVFAPLAECLVDRHRCLAPDLRGHGESGVPPDLDFDWIGFGTDVLTAVDALGLEGPVGIGHSCGGAALLLAEAARPGTFSALYCFEPVVVPTGYLRSRDPSSSLARSARQRREVFASRREAYENYSSKPPFNALNPAALAAYVDFGFDDLADGTVRIRCRGENEARIYEGAARHPAYSRLAKVRCPVLIAYGTDTTHFEPGMFDALVQRLPSGRLEAVAGLGHFGPLEQPATVADSVIRAVEPPSA